MNKSNEKKEKPKTEKVVEPKPKTQAPATAQVKLAPGKTTNLSKAKPPAIWQDVPHVKEIHGTPVHVKGGPAQDVRKRVDGTRMTVAGTEHVGIVRAPGGSVQAGQSLVSGYPAGVPLNPIQVGVRLPQLARSFAKFRFTKYKLWYVPSVTQFNAPAGDIALAFNDDPESALPDLGDDGFNAVSTWANNVTVARFCERLELLCELDLEMQDPLFVDSTEEERFSSQGYALVVAADTNAAFPTGTQGHLFVEYVCELTEPNQPNNVSPTLLAAAAATPSAADGFAFTTGMSFAGSTEIVTSLANVTANGPQFLLNSPADIDVNWMVVLRNYANSAGATHVSSPSLLITGGSGYSPCNSIGGLLADFTSAASPAQPVVHYNLASTNGFNVYGSASLFPIVSNLVSGQVWMFKVRSPVLLRFIAAGVSAGTVRSALTITRIDDDFAARTRAHAPFITVAQARAVEFIVGDQAANLDTLRKLVNGYVADVDAGHTSANQIDLSYLSALSQSLGTDMPRQTKTPHTPVTAPLFLPLLAGAASWFLSKFGPSIASSVLGYGQKKLEEYAEGKAEKATPREKRRARRSRREVEEEEEPDV